MTILPFLLAALAGFVVVSAGGSERSTTADADASRTKDYQRAPRGPRGPRQAYTPPSSTGKGVVRPVGLRDTYHIPYQPPRYMDAQQAAISAPGMHPQIVRPSISEVTFPTGWSIQYLPTSEDILAQTMQMNHKLTPFMRPLLAKQAPVFAYRVVSPSGAVIGSVVVAFRPDGSYHVVTSQGPGSKSLTPQAQTATFLFSLMLNGQSVQA